MPTQTATETDCVVGVHACGCMTYWSADPQDKADAAKYAGRFLAEGGEVVRRNTDELRGNPLFMVSECPHEPKGWERPAPPNPDEWKVRAKRNYRADTKRVEATNRFHYGYVTAGFIRKTERATWHGTLGWFDAEGATANDGRGDDAKPVEVFGPFKTEREAKYAVGERWHAESVVKAEARWRHREANPPERKGPVPTHTDSGAPVPPFKPGEVWVSRGWQKPPRYLILDEPEIAPKWEGGHVRVRARSLGEREDDPMRKWMTPTWTYLGESMFTGPGYMDIDEDAGSVAEPSSPTSDGDEARPERDGRASGSTPPLPNASFSDSEGTT